MSFSRLQYDTEAYKAALNESVQPGKFQLATYAFDRSDHCFNETPEQRVRAGRVFKNFENNDLVNIESDLYGIPRKWSNNPQKKYPYVKTEYKNAPKNPDDCPINNESISTRLIAPQFNRSKSINRMIEQCLDPQQLNRIRSNMFIGVNTRLYNRDNYAPVIPTPLGPTGLPTPKDVQPAMNCQCTLADGSSDKSMKLNKVFCKQG